MNVTQLESTARALVAPGKGILAADESTRTIEKRFEAIGIETTEENRRVYREMLFTTPGAGELHQRRHPLRRDHPPEGRRRPPLVEVCSPSKGIIPGIKVDKGTKALAGFAGETITEGLDGLRERLDEYYGAGRALRQVARRHHHRRPASRPRCCIEANAHALARYAALCQEAGLVPIVEPEVLMDGDHTIERCEEVTEAALHAVFDALSTTACRWRACCSSRTWWCPGKSCPRQAGVQEVAEADAALPAPHRARRGARHRVPLRRPERRAGHRAPQRDERWQGPQPWQLTFSYGRALQAAAQKAWKGDAGRIAAGQKAFQHRARLNGLARSGRYAPEMEQIVA